MPRFSGSAPAQAPRTLAPTPRRRLDECVDRLHRAGRPFATLPIGDRIQLLRAMRAGYARTVPRIVESSCLAKRIVPGTVLEAEEWSLGPWPVMRQFRLLIETLSALRRRRAPPLGELGRTIDGRLSAEIFPGSVLDGVLMPGTRAEVHIRAGIGERDLLAAQARFYRQTSTRGRVVLVLGAGNSAGVPVQDVLTRMFNEGKVCLLKLHPLNDYLAPLLSEAFASAIDRDFLHIVTGDAAEGAYLVRHAGIDEIHLTGCPETHEDILWGSADAGAAERKRQHHPLHMKPVTSELGGVCPVLIVPGPYLDRQLAFQAEALAGALVHNAAMNRHTPRLLVTPRGWPQRDAFCATSSMRWLPRHFVWRTTRGPPSAGSGSRRAGPASVRSARPSPGCCPGRWYPDSTQPTAGSRSSPPSHSVQPWDRWRSGAPTPSSFCSRPWGS